MSTPVEPPLTAGAPIQQQTKSAGLGASGWLYGAAIFLSAFLLFDVQLLVGKFLLPWFGGTSAVWTTCMLFYQVLLLIGYAYAHGVAGRFNRRAQGYLHLALLALAVVALGITWRMWGRPLLPDASWKPDPSAPPILGIIKLLTVSIGLPFLVLSSTAPLLQHWFAERGSSVEGHAKEAPYYLYALSNFGSLLGLLGYPAVIEPFLRLQAQGRFWAIGFGVFAVLCAACALTGAEGNSSTSRQADDTANEERVTPGRRLLWFLFSACGSLYLLAATNLITQDVAPIPLLWVLPLAIYLISFMFVFGSDRAYRRGIYQPLWMLFALAGVIVLFRGPATSITTQLCVFLAGLFAACMVCHGELVRLRPGSRQLTSFYLTMSAGGAAGGIAVGIIAPLVFPAFWEFHVAMFLTAVLIAVALWNDKESWLHQPMPWILPGFIATMLAVIVAMLFVSAGTVSPNMLLGYIAALLVVAVFTAWVRTSGGPAWMQNPLWNKKSILVALVLFATLLRFQVHSSHGTLLMQERNFYGSLSVGRLFFEDGGSSMELLHGRITHGFQLEQARRYPTAYYTLAGGAGISVISNPRNQVGAMRVGAVGLGTGTLAVYSRPGDYYRFYEINPAVITLAKGEGGYFTFLKDARGTVETVLGDARLSMEAEAARGEPQNFDLLFVDAFNGDSIPVHLLTREAFQLYLKHLRGAESVIAVHTSNLTVNLKPVVAGVARDLGMYTVLIRANVKDRASLPSQWVLVSRSKEALSHPLVLRTGSLTVQPGEQRVVWTDDYSNVLTLMRH